jgi:hypothetical protein
MRALRTGGPFFSLRASVGIGHPAILAGLAIEKKAEKSTFPSSQ